MLTPEELKQVLPAETCAYPSPIPTQNVSSDEYMPCPQTEKQREFEARVQGVRRRARAEAGHDPPRVLQDGLRNGRRFPRDERHVGAALRGLARRSGDARNGRRAREGAEEPVHHGHAHALPAGRHAHQDLRRAARHRRSARLESALQGKEQTIDDLKFANYFKEMFMDSDTKVACISGSPSHEPQDWFLTNEMKFDARAKVNKEAGTKRMFSHAIITPGMAGLAGEGRLGLREAQARFVQGLHGRRQHEQAPVEVSLSPR